VSVCTTIFGRWLQDGGDDCIQKLKTTPGTDQGPRYLDFDNVLEILFDLWCSVRISWEAHLQYLFAKYCSVYRVIGDVMFANDVLGSTKDRDVMLVNIQKVSASDCSRRPMRMIQRPDVSVKEVEEAGDLQRISRLRQFKQGNANKETVCDAITRTEFCIVLALVDPSMSSEKMGVIFEDACELSFEMISRVLERMWVCCWDEKLQRHFYVNRNTNIAQWTRPYHQKNFRTREIEEDAFVKVAMKFDILANGPFVELLYNRPQDLWSNSEMFLKQQEIRTKRALANREDKNSPNLLKEVKDRKQKKGLRKSIKKAKNVLSAISQSKARPYMEGVAISSNDPSDNDSLGSASCTSLDDDSYAPDGIGSDGIGTIEISTTGEQWRGEVVDSVEENA
jgi:WW domain